MSCLCRKEKPEWSAWPRLLPLLWAPGIQTHSYVGGPRNEITILEPEALQVLQLINSLKLQALWPLKSIKATGRSGFLGSVCGTCMSQVMSLPARTGLPHFLHQFPLKRPFWPLKQQAGVSAPNTAVLSQLYCNLPSNSLLRASGTPWPASLYFSLLIWLFLGISQLLHSHHAGTAP